MSYILCPMSYILFFVYLSPFDREKVHFVNFELNPSTNCLAIVNESFSNTPSSILRKRPSAPNHHSSFGQNKEEFSNVYQSQYAVTSDLAPAEGLMPTSFCEVIPHKYLEDFGKLNPSALGM